MKFTFRFILMFVVLAVSTSAQVTITAHRGASGYAPENTKSSISKAIALKADIVEIDVQETSDGEIILLHDNSLARTAGIDRNIWETSSSDLTRLDAGSWFDTKFRDEPIPKLVEVLKLAENKIKLNIELKTNGHEELLADRTVKIVLENSMADECCFTSFSFREADRVKEINPDLKAGYIFSKFPKDIDVFTADIDILSVHYSLVDKDFMTKAELNNKEVHVWTVNDEEEMKRLINLGVTSIITNYPDVLAGLVK